jgi:N-carbamoyl-L-amino-acid hydrolase
MHKLLGFYVYLLIIGTTYAQTTDIQIDTKRLERNMSALAELNSPKETKRLSITSTNLEGRAFLMRLMREAGLKVSIDYAGNIIGTRAGWDPNYKPITIGTTIDKAAELGELDGYVSSLAAVEVIQTFLDHDLFTDHPLEIIIFADEDEGAAGSLAMIGELNKELLRKPTPQGFTLEEGIKQLGGNPEKLELVARPKGSVEAFLEIKAAPASVLGIERRADIALVDRMVDQRLWRVTIQRLETHSGITATEKRNGVLMTGTNLSIYIKELQKGVINDSRVQFDDIREIYLKPSDRNGQLTATLEISDQSSEAVNSLYMNLRDKARKLEKTAGISIQFDPLPIPQAEKLDPHLQEVIGNAASSIGLSTAKVDSGTDSPSHEMIRIAPSATILLPVDPYSNRKKEGSQLSEGANLLLHTLLSLDKELQSSPLGGN